METSEIKKLLEEAKQQLKSIVIVEDKEFLLALINGKIEKEDHKQKHEKMIELMKKIEKL
jgi:succinate dehydrogenase flavin-adding protein (antitoxin of CptAB toxin-antitoxin module)